MKRHWITALAACLTLVVLAGSLSAKENKGRRVRKGDADGPKRVRRGPGGPRKMPDVGLTDEQKGKIEEIRKAAMAEIKDAKPTERREIFAKMRKDIHAVFTEEQLAKLKKAREEGGRGKRPDLGLTDEQKAKMAEIRKAAAAKMKDAKPEDRKGIMEDARKEMEAILTPEQLEKFKKMRAGGRHGRGQMPDVGLTDEQKAKIAEIRKAAMAEARKAKPQERRTIVDKMHKDIRALLTEEQLDKLKKARQGGRRGGERAQGQGRKPRGGRRGRKGEGKDRPDGE